jgi:HEAT repeat protein
LLLLGGGTRVGCHSAAEDKEHPIYIVGVDDRASGVPDGVRFDPERSRRHLEAALADSRTMYVVEQREPAAYRAELVISLASERESEREEQTGVYRAVQVELHVHREQGEQRDWLTAQGKAFLVQEPDEGERNEGFDRVLDRAVAKAVEYIDLQFECRVLGPEQLRERLNSEQAEQRLYVLRSLRDRDLPEMVPDVVRRLADPDEDVVLEAVGVLVAQRDRRAVKPLIALSRSRDLVFKLQIITAMAEIGGPVARGYLFTLAAGHPAEEIRQRAREGLARIERSGAQAAGDLRNSPVAWPQPGSRERVPDQ